MTWPPQNHGHVRQKIDELLTRLSALEGKTSNPSTAPSVSLSSSTATSAVINWQAPISSSSVITGYRVGRDGIDSNGTGIYSTTVSATTFTFTFNALVTGNTYNLSVKAITAEGDSPPGTVSVTPVSSGVGVSSPAQPTGGAYVGSSVLFVDEFTGTTLNTVWQAGDGAYQRNAPGFSSTNKNGIGDETWHVYPMDSETYSIADSILTMKARRRSGLPGQPASAQMTGCLLNTDTRWEIPDNTTTFIESKQWIPSGTGIFTAFWMMGYGTFANGTNWPYGGEVDITEFVNGPGGGGREWWGLLCMTMHWDDPNAAGAQNIQSQQIWDPPQGPQSPTGPQYLHDSWHVYGMYRSASKMELFVDGVKVLTWLPNTSYNGYPGAPVNPIFTGKQSLRLDIKSGGNWAGQNLTASQYQPGDFKVDYVKVWSGITAA